MRVLKPHIQTIIPLNVLDGVPSSAKLMKILAEAIIGKHSLCPRYGLNHVKCSEDRCRWLTKAAIYGELCPPIRPIPGPQEKSRMRTATAQKNVFLEGVDRLLAEFDIRLTPDERLKGFMASPKASLWKERNFDKNGVTPKPYHDADVRIVWKPGSCSQESAFRLLIEERRGSNDRPPTAHDYHGWHEIHLVAGARALACQVFNGREYLARPTDYIEGRLQKDRASYTDVRPDVNESAHIGEDAALAIVRACLQFLQKYLRRQEMRQTILDWFIAHGLGTQRFQHPGLPRVTLSPCGPYEHLDAEFRGVGNECDPRDLKTAVAFCIHGNGDHDLKDAAFLARFTHDPEAGLPWQSEYVSRLPKGQDGPVVAMVQQRDVAGVLSTMNDCYEYYRYFLKNE